MKRFLLKTWLATAVMFTGLTASGAGDAPPSGYGILALGNDQPGLMNHLVSFPLVSD